MAAIDDFAHVVKAARQVADCVVVAVDAQAHIIVFDPPFIAARARCGEPDPRHMPAFAEDLGGRSPE